MVVTEVAEPRLLTLSQTADLLGIGMTSLKPLVYSGEIPSVVLGARMRRIPRRAVEEYIQRLLDGK